jgi:hypothetical protein
MIASEPFPWATYGPTLQWCRVCGTTVWFPTNPPKPDEFRCERHIGRNPCAINGCKKSTKAPASGELSMDDYLCPRHWRQFVPVGSPARRIYNRFFRRARRYGWTTKSKRAFWRFWYGLVRRARRSSAGDIDVREINRVMGW